MKATYIAHERADVDFWVRLHDIDLILEVYWAVTFNLKLLGVGLANQAGFAHIDEFGEEFILARIYNWKRMDWNQYFITFAMYSDRVVEILKFRARCELYIDVFRHSSWDHTLFIVLYFEECCCRW